jgi:hypothetical protein
MIDHKLHPMNTFNLSHIPVLFLGMDTFGRAQASFLAALTKNIGNNDRDRMFCSKVNGAKKAKRLKLMSQKQRRLIFKQVSPTPLC